MHVWILFFHSRTLESNEYGFKCNLLNIFRANSKQIKTADEISWEDKKQNKFTEKI